MDKQEADRIAATITSTVLPGLRVLNIEPHEDGFQIRCTYTGPEKRWQNTILVHGIQTFVTSPREWASLQNIIVNGK